VHSSRSPRDGHLFSDPDNGHALTEMDGLQRVTFRFGRDREVRYLPQIPKAGDFVTHWRELWVVTFVTQDTAGRTVICDPPRGDGHRLEHVA
jgi:hypothetical protein